MVILYSKQNNFCIVVTSEIINAYVRADLLNVLVTRVLCYVYMLNIIQLLK